MGGEMKEAKEEADRQKDNQEDHCFKTPFENFGKRKCSTEADTDGDLVKPKRQIATNTIMITNNLNNSRSSASANNSKITITAHDQGDLLLDRRPMVVDQINICINNHFSNDSVTTTTTATTTKKIPDLIQIQKEGKKSKTDPIDLIQMVKKEKEFKNEKQDDNLLKTAVVNHNLGNQKQETLGFKIGDDVLAHRKTFDDRFYLGVVAAVNANKCLVQFEDNTGCWSYFDELKRLKPFESLLCVICKARRLVNVKLEDDKEAVGTANDLIEASCLWCGRAYHKLCLDQKVDELGLRGKFTKYPETKCLRCLQRKADDQASDRNDQTISNDTGNFYPFHRLLGLQDWFNGVSLAHDDEDVEEAAKEDEVAINNNEEASSRDEDELFNYVNGRRLRKRQEIKSYADNARRSLTAPNPVTTTFHSSSASSSCSSSSSSSCGSSSAVSFFSSSIFSLSHFSTAFISKKHRLLRCKLKQRKGKAGASSSTVPYTAPLNKIFETQNRLARGEKYEVRGKRLDKDGNVQYLVEWSDGVA